LHDRPLHREYIAGTLWTNGTQEHANANLRTAVWRLRKVDRALLDATTRELALGGAVAIDVVGMTARAQRALTHRTEPGDLAALCTAGDLLPDWYEDWLDLERERLRQLRLHALEALCIDLIARGDLAAATEAGLAAVASEPLRESAHRALIQVHLAEGNCAEALRAYRFYKERIGNELGLKPSAGIRKLLQTVRWDAERAGELRR
jgi:DNA-binding SARP family transcriptional activator